jgi:hypothetical protein
VSARSVAGDAAVVDQQDEAAKCGADGVSGTDELGHVVGLVLVAEQGAVEGIDDDDRGRGGELIADGGDQCRGVVDQIDGFVDKEEGGLVVSYEPETDTRTAKAAIGADVQIGL